VHKKLTSLLAVIVALGGFALAVFIPAASASKAHDTYTEYCEGGTNTMYSEYDQYCQSTTTVATNGTTTVVTSPVTPITLTTPGSTPVNPGGVVIGANGDAVINLRDLTVGETFTANGVKVEVLAISATGVTMSFGGVVVTIPFGALVSIAPDGVVNVAYAISGGKVSARVGEASSAAKASTVTRQYLILPSGRSSSSAAYVLPKGVSFGAHTTWAQIAKDLHVYTMGKNAVKVPLKVTANKARSAFTIKLAKAEKNFVIYFNVSKLQYTKTESTYLKAHGVKSLAPKFSVTSKTSAAKSSKADKFAFEYPV
jgi:hypothetical protein